MPRQLDNKAEIAGEHVRRITAQRLSAVVRRRDIVVRCGGDAFLVTTDQTSPPCDLKRLARRIAGALEQPILLDSHETTVSATIGIVPCKSANGPVEALIVKAVPNNPSC